MFIEQLNEIKYGSAPGTVVSYPWHQQILCMCRWLNFECYFHKKYLRNAPDVSIPVTRPPYQKSERFFFQAAGRVAPSLGSEPWTKTHETVTQARVSPKTLSNADSRRFSPNENREAGVVGHIP